MSGFLNLPGEQRVYVEEHGDGGEPVFLLHGGFSGADSWEPQVEALKDKYRVFVPERRGHGRSPDVPGPYTVPVMAEETAAVIDALAPGPVHLVGWSDGAFVAAYLTLHRPDLVRSGVWIGQPFTKEAETPGEITPAEEAQLRESVGGDPVVFDKVISLWRNPAELGVERFAEVAVPVLVMQGDDDCVRIDWNRRLAASLPKGQFAVVPGTGHGAPSQRASLVNHMILEFLADPEPERSIPLGALKAW